MGIFHPLVVIMKTNCNMTVSRRCPQLPGIFDYSGMLLY